MFNRYLLVGTISLGFIIGYNIWLAQRDDKLFKAYSASHPVCSEYTFHPDCNQ